MIKPHDAALSDLSVGGEGDVVALDADPERRVRLMELGFCPETRVRLVRRAPFGCPLEVEVGGSRFSVRVEVARSVLIRHA